MSLFSIHSALVIAATGYGEISDGQPTWEQRELHTYTNLVRVEPEAWEAEYDCRMSDFTLGERTPAPTLYYHDGLTTIAQQHTEDMATTGELTHDSSDGTDFSARVWPWYEGNTIGENVAWGYRDNWSALFEGWMCSDGHRVNIMHADFEHMGTGVDDQYYTQDFGGGGAAVQSPAAMGVHLPRIPTDTVTFLTTWDAAAAPAVFAVETIDACLDMEELVGTPERGAWQVEAAAGADCQAYRFVWETASGETGALPESGAYQYGEGCAPWIDAEPLGCAPEDPAGAGGSGDSADTNDDGRGDLWPGQGDGRDDDDSSSGCAVSPTPSRLGLLLLPLLGLVRRATRR